MLTGRTRNHTYDGIVVEYRRNDILFRHSRRKLFNDKCSYKIENGTSIMTVLTGLGSISIVVVYSYDRPLLVSTKLINNP